MKNILFLAALFLTFAAFAHEHKAPHGGTLIEFGDEFAHVELVLEPATGKITAYVLDGEAEKAVRVKDKDLELKISKIDGKEMPVDITLKPVANVLTGETVGDTSEFNGQSDKLKNVKTFEAHVKRLFVKGKEFNHVKFKFPEGNEEKEKEKSKK